MKISVVIPTRWDEKNISHMIQCFQNQTFQDFEVIFVVDKTKESKDQRIETSKNIQFITNVNSDFVPWQWVSYVRNYWIEIAKWEFINLMDDDEDFEADYLQKSLDLREKYREKIWKDFVLTPTLMYRKTWDIQSQWFKNMNWRFGRPIPYRLEKKNFWLIQMYSCNSLFGPNKIFKTVKFDEKMDFVNEDLDFTYRMHKSWYPLIVTKNLEINHLERDKTRLENRRIGNNFQIYKKARHKILFANKNGKTYEKIIFYAFWLWIFVLASIARILFLWKNISKINLVKNLFKWIIWMK